MTDSELLIECKKGIGAPITGTNLDGPLTQKLITAKAFMKGAGVTEEIMNEDLAVGTIVMGVTDLWNLKSGEIKFSPLFYTLLGQLVAKSSVIKVSTAPADGTTAVALSVQPVLTFNTRIKSYKVSLVNYDSKIPIRNDSSLDITGKILTLDPQEILQAQTKYAIVLEKATAHTGPSMEYKVFGFTTI